MDVRREPGGKMEPTGMILLIFREKMENERGNFNEIFK